MNTPKRPDRPVRRSTGTDETSTVQQPPDAWLESALLDAVPDRLVVIGSDQRIMRVNNAFCAWTGFSRSELIGLGQPYPYWPDGEQQRGDARLQRIEQAGAGEFELTVRRADGALLDAVMSASPAYVPDGQLIGYVATYKDLTAARREARLERALREVASQNAFAEHDESALADLVARRVAELLDTANAAVVRFEDERLTVIGAAGQYPFPATHSTTDESVSSQVARTGCAARVNDYGQMPGEIAALAASRGITAACRSPSMPRRAVGVRERTHPPTRRLPRRR